MELKRQRVSLRSLFEHMHQLISLQTSTKNLKLTVRLDGTIPEFVYTDKRRLMQVLVNLCFNSIKYTFQGEIALTGMMRGEKLFVAEVRDTGIGIEPSLRDNISRMFGLIERKSVAHETGLCSPDTRRRNRTGPVLLQGGADRAGREPDDRVGAGQGHNLQGRVAHRASRRRS